MVAPTIWLRALKAMTVLRKIPDSGFSPAHGKIKAYSIFKELKIFLRQKDSSAKKRLFSTP